MNYLGYIVSEEGLAVDKEKTKAVDHLRPPSTRSELKSFLGLTGVYRRFVRNFDTIAAPLTKLLKKGQPEVFRLDKEQISAFEELKKAITNSPVLALPKFGSSIVIETDTSAEQLGAVILQEEHSGVIFFS